MAQPKIGLYLIARFFRPDTLLTLNRGEKRDAIWYKRLLQALFYFRQFVAQTSKSAVSRISQSAGASKSYCAVFLVSTPAGWEAGDTAGLETRATPDGIGDYLRDEDRWASQPTWGLRG